MADANKPVEEPAELIEKPVDPAVTNTEGEEKKKE